MSYEVAYAIQIPRCKMQIQVQDQIESNYQLILFLPYKTMLKSLQSTTTSTEIIASNSKALQSFATPSTDVATML